MAAQTPVPGCTRHEGMGFVYVCKSCDDQVVCMDCVTDNHNGHTLGKLTEYMETQKREIQYYVDKLSKSEIPKVEEDIREFEANIGGYKKLIGDIKRQGKEMKDSIDTAVDLLVKMCAEIDKMNKSISEKNIDALKTHLKKDLKPKLDRCQETLMSGTTVDVTSLAREIRNNPTNVTPNLTRLQALEFKPGKVSPEILKRMLGRILVDGDDQSYTYKYLPKSEALVKTPFLFDSCESCLTSDQAWLSYWDSENVYRLDVKGDVKEKVECEGKIQRISVSPTTGRLWFCLFEDQSIREVTADKNIVTRFKVNNIPVSLCVTSDDMVVVGMKGGIQLYTTDGRVVSDGAGRPYRQAAVWPHHMASCPSTGDIAVVDSDCVYFDEYIAGKTKIKQPSAIVMDKHLNLKLRYTNITAAKSSVQSSQLSKFYPYDVCFDGAGNVLLTEFVTKSVLLIDGDTGGLLRTIYASDGEMPWCISLHDDGTLWIGHRDNRMKIIKYK
ncbi:uncharacterized protein [Argopecten irradians]|uniref:uncharacterized protein n=1 Tax=Argopecten irradians TaxID=31199 RepID=UPI00371168CA